MANPQNLKPFKQGDPRINRKGRPKNFDALRELAQAISHEVAQSAGEPIVIDGHTATVAEMILRQWAQSKNPQLQRAFVEYAFGKVPERQEHTGANGTPLLGGVESAIRQVYGDDSDGDSSGD